MIIAFPSSADFTTMNAAYGTPLPLATLELSQGTAQTIIGSPDVDGDAALRAGIIGETALPTTLTDGRLALSGTFSDALLAAIAAGTVAAQELTDAEFAALIPPAPILG
jgi:hypothetical protein